MKIQKTLFIVLVSIFCISGLAIAQERKFVGKFFEYDQQSDVIWVLITKETPVETKFGMMTLDPDMQMAFYNVSKLKFPFATLKQGTEIEVTYIFKNEGHVLLAVKPLNKK